MCIRDRPFFGRERAAFPGGRRLYERYGDHRGHNGGCHRLASVGRRFFLKEKQRIDAGADFSWLDRRVSPKSAIVLAAVAYAIGLAITISTLLTS